jgi:xanthine dehydrogenase YagR molybdenum-binding subunit
MSPPGIGQALSRVEGRAKVTGSASYAADFNQPGQAYAVIVGSTVGLGRVVRIDSAPVLQMPGILAVISHENAPRLTYGPHKSAIDPAVGERLHVLQDDQVRCFGQPVAVIVADTLDQAERAALARRRLGPHGRSWLADPNAPSFRGRDAAGFDVQPTRRRRHKRTTRSRIDVTTRHGANHNPCRMPRANGPRSPDMWSKSSSSATSRPRSRRSSVFRPSRSR